MKLKSILSAIAAAALGALSLVTASPAFASANCGSLQIDPIHSDTFYIDKASGFDAGYLGFKVSNNSGSSVSGGTLTVSLSGGTVTLVSGESNSRTLGTIADSSSAYFYFFAKSSATADTVSTTGINYIYNDGSVQQCSLTTNITKVDDVLDTNASTIATVSVAPASSSIQPGTDVTVTVVGNSGNIGNGDNNDPHSIMLAPVVRSANFDPSHYRLKSATYVASSGSCALPNLLRNIGLGGSCDGGYTATYVFETLSGADQTIASKIDGQTYIASGANIKHPGVKTMKSLPLVKANVTVTYAGNGGTGSVASQTGSGTITLSDNGYTYTCHIFTGWNTAKDGSGDNYDEKEAYTGTTSITLYAQWAADTRCTPAEIAAAEAEALAETGSTDSAPLAIAAFVLLVVGIAIRARKRA